MARVGKYIPCKTIDVITEPYPKPGKHFQIKGVPGDIIVVQAMDYCWSIV